MSPNPDTKTHTPSDHATPVAPTDTAAVETRPVPERRALAYWLITIFIVFSGSLVSLSWYGWQLFQANGNRIDNLLAAQQQNQEQLRQIQQTDHAALSELRTALEQSQHDVQASLNTLRQKTTTDVDQTQERLQALESNFARLQDQLGRGALAWQVQDINTLLTHAQEQLSIARDPAAARAALMLADQRLAALARPQVLPVRSAISDALAALRTADAFDAIGMSLALRRAADSVRDWPIKGQSAPQSAPPTSSTAPATDAPWYIRWPAAVWHPIADWLGRQFIVTRDGAPVSQGARYATDQEMRLWLTGVREALMTRDVPALSAAITQASDWLDAHYDTNAPSVRAVSERLHTIDHFYQNQSLPSLAPVFHAWQASGLLATPVSPPPTVSAHPETQP